MPVTQEVEKLSFYTTGESFTPLLRNFVYEGSYYQAYEILKGGGLSDDLIKEFFLFQGEFIGDTREEKGMGFNTCERPDDIDIEEVYHTGLRTLMSPYRNKKKPENQLDPDDDYDTPVYFPYEFLLLKNTDKNLKALFKIFTEQEVIDLVFKRFLIAYKFKIAQPSDMLEPNGIEHGIILQNGIFIKTGYDET